MNFHNWDRMGDGSCCFEVIEKKSGVVIEVKEDCINYYRNLSKLLNLFVVNEERLVEVMSEYQREQCVSYKECVMIISSLIPQNSNKTLLNEKSYHELFQFLLDLEGSEDVVQINDLFLFIMTLCKGDISDKFESLFHCLGGRLKSVDDYIISSSKLEYLLNFYLCLFLGHAENYQLSLERIKEISNDNCSTAMNHILLFNKNNSSIYKGNLKKMKKPYISLRMFEKWFKIYGSSMTPWMRYIDLHDIDRPNKQISNEITPNVSEISNNSPESSRNYQYYYSNNNNYDNDEDDDDGEEEEGESEESRNSGENNNVSVNSESSEPDELIFDFPLSGNNNHLCITNNNIDFVIELVEECKLYYFSCNDLYELLLKYTYQNNEHFILRSKYYEFLKDIIPPKYHEFFIDLYNAFDLTSTNSINIKQLYLCLSILINGSKSEKLFYNFNLISSKNIESSNNHENSESIPYFTITDMIYCLRSYLTLLMCINKRSNRHEISNIIYNTCIEVSYQLFNDYNYNNNIYNENIIVFEDFANWYNESGYLLTPWIELLDIKKWKICKPESNGENNNDNNESIAIEKSSNRKKNKAVKLNPILVAIGQNYNILFSEEVIDLYYHIRDSIYENTNGTSSEDLLLEILKLNNNEVYVDYETYIEILELFIGKEDEESEAEEEEEEEEEENNANLKFYFNQIYKMFYKNLDNNIIEIITMFLFFLDGTKSDKLNLMFLYFDQTRNYELNMVQIYSFLSSLLLTIINLTPDKEITLFQIHDLINDIINTHFINNNNNSEYISLEKFATWYNDYGYEIMSWIELISPNKWPNRNVKSSQISSQYQGSIYSVSQQQQQDNDDEGKNIIYEFELFPNKRLLIIDVNSNKKLNDINASFKFNKCTINSFFKEVKQFLPTNLNEEVNSNIILSKVSNKLFRSDRNGLKSFKSYFNYIYSILEEDSMSYAEFLTSLSIFMENNKTTKLCECWLYFIDNDKIPSPLSTSSSQSEASSYITRDNFRRYLRSFLLSLFYICDITKNSNELNIIDKHIDFVYDNMIEYYSYNNKQSIYTIEEYISFIDFANYYNAKGSQYISWLELLDLSKWPIEPSQLQLKSNRYYDYVNQIDNEIDDSESDGDDEEEEEENDNVYENVNGNNDKRNYQINSFNLELCNKNYLSVTNDNTLRLLEFLKESGFATLTCSEISDLLSKEMIDGNDSIITKEKYNEILEQLISHINNHNISNIFNTVSTIFEFLPLCSNSDYNNDNIRCINDILIVYNFFGIGSKSEKLEYSFNLYSGEKKDGIVTLSDLKSIFYDYLISISLFNRIHQYKNNKYNEIYEIEKIKNIVNENVNKVMKSVSEFMNNNSRIAFDAFAKWYSESGYYVAPWIELLDIKKWPNSNGNIDNYNDNTNTAINNIFTFANGNNILTFLPIDIIHHKYLVDNIKLNEISSEEMINKIHEIIEYEDNIEIPKESFDDIITKLVVKDDKKIIEIFNKIYALLPNHNIKTIIGLLACYCNDKKSDKLFHIVNIFNNNPSEQDTMLKKEDITKLLTDIYYSICICKYINNNCEYRDIDDGDDDNNYNNEIMKDVVDMIYSDLDLSDNQTISFDIFAEWYSNGGYTAVPWIELLDLSKWPKVIEEEQPIVVEDIENNENVEEEEEERVYTFNLLEDEKKITISQSSSMKIKEILELTQLNTMSVIDIKNNLSETMNKELKDENEKEEDFENSILSFLPNNNVYTNDEKVKIKNELKDMYNNVSYILNKENEKIDDNLKYILCSLLLYLKGNKSDKLSMIYNILQMNYNEGDEGDKGISAKDYKILLFCILRRIFEMNDENEEKKDETSEKECESVIKRLFEYYKRDINNDKVDFIEFADWYSKEGENSMKWIELLDLSKWP